MWTDGQKKERSMVNDVQKDGWKNVKNVHNHCEMLYDC